MQFSGNFKGKPLFWANFGLRAHPWGQNSAGPPWPKSWLRPCISKIQDFNLILIPDQIMKSKSCACEMRFLDSHFVFHSNDFIAFCCSDLSCAPPIVTTPNKKSTIKSNNQQEGLKRLSNPLAALKKIFKSFFFSKIKNQINLKNKKEKYYILNFAPQNNVRKKIIKISSKMFVLSWCHSCHFGLQQIYSCQ